MKNIKNFGYAVYFSFAAMLFISSESHACPNSAEWGDVKVGSASDLYSPKSYSVIAGGGRSLRACGINALNEEGSLSGWVTSDPDFSLKLDNIDGYEIEFRVRSNCDTVLLVNTAINSWYFDDDDGDGNQPKIRLRNPRSDGIYDVWIGTYDEELCDARLIVETF